LEIDLFSELKLLNDMSTPLHYRLHERLRTSGACVVTLLAGLLLPQANAAAVELSYLPPLNRTEWRTVDPAVSGWNVQALADLVSFAESRKSTGLLIVQDGKIVAEHYWPVTRYDALTRPRFYFYFSHSVTSEGWPIEDVASVQKSLSSVLVGKAEGQGLLDIDAPVSRYLGKGWSKAGEAEQAILVRHLLSMNSGLDTDLNYEQPAGTHWRYNTAAYSRIVPVLEAATHQKIGPLTKEWLFDPIGMRDSNWTVRSSTWTSSNASPVGFVTTPRDLARLGLLVLMEGKWGSKDIIGNDRWFPLSVSTSQDSNPAYGFLWWLNGTAKHARKEPPLQDGTLVTSAPQDLITAMGHEKRRLYISPSHKLVIVRFGSDPGGGFDNEFWKRASTALPQTAAVSQPGEPEAR
jgi:CubicO group peptidase (beta-lactamase class C family)